jgi:hypothetical protein
VPFDSGPLSQLQSNTTVFAPYQAPGGGTFSFDIQTVTSFTPVLPLGVNFNITSATINTSAEVEFFASEVPEPSTFAFLGAGLILMAAGGYKRRQQTR